LVNDKGADGTSVYDRIISSYNIINHSNDGITDEMVVDLVNRTSLDVAGDTQGTIQKINNSEAPYVDPDMPSLYSFVYDDSLTVVAHPTNRLLVGVNLKGKPDVSGKLFRDEILAGALANGTGWEDYIYTKPEEGGLYYKTSYYKLTSGSDGKLYIVCAGKYK
jgi:polar amino acid transport system substrate-binding protein